MEIGNKELDSLLETVNKRYGYDFSNYSKATIKRRITSLMHKRHISSFFDLKHLLINEETFFIDFLQHITINVTEMFRDPSFYHCLREKVFPQLATYPFIKLWHAGCSTGEEVFSMAILLKEAGLLERTKLYATDINPMALNKAKQGLFSIKHMKEYTQNYRKAGGEGEFSDYYTAKYDSVIFDQSLKKNMIFSLHNLVCDQSFNEFNLVICRNVLIYFDKILQDQVIQLFTKSLCPLGFLGLGSKESLLFTEARDHFNVVEDGEKIFKKIK